MMALKGKIGLLLGAAGALVWLGAGVHPAAQAQGQGQAPKAKITPWAAMRIANDQVHGQPLSANYGNDEGKWIYDVMIAKGSVLNVVEVDANTGKADKPETSTPEDEAKEMVSDLNKALGKTSGSATVQESGEKGEKPN